MRTLRLVPVLAAACSALGCPARPPRPLQPGPSGATTPYGPAGQHGQMPTRPDGTASTSPFTPAEQVAPERQVTAFIAGHQRVLDIDEARAAGFTIIDLSDDWVPYIFWSQTPGKEDFAENAYAKTYVGLANDQIDLDGIPLERAKRNYLEVYGIPPSLSVIRKRLLEEKSRRCFERANYEHFTQYFGPVRTVDARAGKRLRRNYLNARAEYRKALRKTRLRSMDDLAQRPEYAAIVRRYQKYSWQVQAIKELARRLRCENLLERGARVKPGFIDWHLRNALKRFERRHRIYGWGMIFQTTADALARNPQETALETLKRVITDRVVDARGIVEDGSSSATYTDEHGTTQQVGDVISQQASLAIRELGISDAASAEAFLERHAETFHRFFVAVRLPPLPVYYADAMDLSVVIDRGDVWYELPFDDEGKPRPQPRRKKPMLTLFVNYQNRKIPLLRWHTTIGGWQKERRHSQEYYKYKISDVGPRIWKHIVAGPVWIPPKVTPSGDLVKVRRVRRRNEPIVAQSTFGPGYASAYGLVAAYHIEKSGFDNQIRTHGTVNYMSVRSGFSHGCHRLHNDSAVRLFSFILRHREFVRKGQTKLAYHHTFEHRGEQFRFDIRTRGYYYELTPPVQVEVLEGRIRGDVEQPIEDYVKKPSVVYQEDLPGHQDPAKTNTGSKAPHRKKKPASRVRQRQML